MRVKAKLAPSLVFIVLNILLASYFFNTILTDNPVSRSLPIVSMMESGTMQIDQFQKLTIDKSKIDGHYYTDKAPLGTYLPMPIAFILFKWHLVKVSKFRDLMEKLVGLGSFVCGTIPFIIMFFLVFKKIDEISDGYNPYILSMFLMYGSNLFIYAGQYWGHMLGAVLTLISYILIKEKKNVFMGGMCLGFAVTAEYPTGLFFVTFALSLYLLEKDFSKVLTFFAGGIVPALLLMSYHYIYTGSPFSPLYWYVATDKFAAMKSNLGFNLPDITVLFKLIFGPYRGMFFYTPVLILILFLFIKKPPRLNPKKVCVNFLFPSIAAYLLMNASYFMWHGGWCHGPRHLLPITALILYESVSLLFQDDGKYKYYFFYALSTIGILFNWMTKSVYEIYPDTVRFPLKDYVWTSFKKGMFDNSNILSNFLGINKAVSVFMWPCIFIFGSLLLVWMVKQKSIPQSPNT